MGESGGDYGGDADDHGDDADDDDGDDDYDEGDDVYGGGVPPTSSATVRGCLLYTSPSPRDS